MSGGWESIGIWLAVAVVVTSVLYVAYYVLHRAGYFAPRLPAVQRDMRMTWKVVKLGDPVLEGFGLKGTIEYGVIISSDEMLEKTQTLLFCPLFSGVDKASGTPLAVLPWHVPVQIRREPERHNVEVDYGRKYVSTKIVLPIAAGEIDMDGLERGYLDESSRIAVAKKLAAWMPSFARIAHV